MVSDFLCYLYFDLSFCGIPSFTKTVTLEKYYNAPSLIKIICLFVMLIINDTSEGENDVHVIVLIPDCCIEILIVCVR